MHDEYVTRALSYANDAITATIRRNNIFTFANRTDGKKRDKHTNHDQKQNMVLVTKLFLSLQSRTDADMEDFF